MKKVVLGLLMAMCLCACQKPYEKAVKKYIEENFNDPSSYECVELSEPVEYTAILLAYDRVEEVGKAEGWSADSIFNKKMELRPYFEKQKINPNEVLFRYCTHTYRAANSFGAKVLHKEKWFFNKDYTSVLRVEEEK